MKTFIFACYGNKIVSIHEIKETIEIEGNVCVDNTIGLLVNGKVNADSKEDAVDFLNKLIEQDETEAEHEFLRCECNC